MPTPRAGLLGFLLSALLIPAAVAESGEERIRVRSSYIGGGAQEYEIIVLEVTSTLGITYRLAGKEYKFDASSTGYLFPILEALCRARKDASLLITLARKELSHGLTPLAERILEKAVEISPDYLPFKNAIYEAASRFRSSGVLKALASPALELPGSPPSPLMRAILDLLAAQPPASAADLSQAYLTLQEARLVGEVRHPWPASISRLEEAARTVSPKGSVTWKDLFEPLTTPERDALKDLLKANPKLRTHLTILLRPGYDDYYEAARIVLRLAKAYPNDFAGREALVAAFAVTWDMRTSDPWDERTKRPGACTLEEAFAWYVKNEAQLMPGFRGLPARLLTFVAVSDLAISEREWVVKNYRYSPDLGRRAYSDVPSKDLGAKGTPAGAPQTLDTLRGRGGIAQEQAFFARSVCTSLGQPLATSYGAHYKWLAGSQLYPGSQNPVGFWQGWVSWLIKEGEGRYRTQANLPARSREEGYPFSYYDPQTLLRCGYYVFDFEARACSAPLLYGKADLFYRLAVEAGPHLTAPSRAGLLKASVQSFPWHRQAWSAIGRAVLVGDMTTAEANQLLQAVRSQCTACPEFPTDVASSYDPAEVEKNFSLRAWDRNVADLLKLLKGDKSQATSYRISEVDEFRNEGLPLQAVRAAQKGLQESATDSTPELAARYAALMRELRQLPKAPPALLDALSRLGQGTAPWEKTAEILKGVYEELGDRTNAKAWEDKLRGAK